MSPEDMKMLKEKIFEEADTGQKGFLDYEDIQKVLWATNLEHKCSMHFFENMEKFNKIKEDNEALAKKAEEPVVTA